MSRLFVALIYSHSLIWLTSMKCKCWIYLNISQSFFLFGIIYRPKSLRLLHFVFIYDKKSVLKWWECVVRRYLQSIIVQIHASIYRYWWLWWAIYAFLLIALVRIRSSLLLSLLFQIIYIITILYFYPEYYQDLF